MAQLRAPSRSWLLTRVCPRCGYSGPEVQACDDEPTYDCPRCGEDLYARPARSYAEMEGLASDTGPRAAPPCHPNCCRRVRSGRLNRFGLMGRVLERLLRRPV